MSSVRSSRSGSPPRRASLSRTPSATSGASGAAARRSGAHERDDEEEVPARPASTSKEKARPEDGSVAPARDGQMTVADEDVEEKDKDKFKQLSWQRLAICLIVEAVALGTLSLPAVYATVGLVPGVILTVGIGAVATYTSYVVGLACHRSHIPIFSYPDLGERMFGRWGREIFMIMFVLLQLLASASHTLTGAIAFTTITEAKVCSIVWSVVSAVLLFLCALPPTYANFSLLAFADFVSLLAAVITTIVATGVQASRAPGGLGAVDWHAFPQERPSFADAFVAVANICFYTFVLGQPTMQAELRRSGDFPKAVWAIGAFETVFYTVVASLIYVFVGSDVKSPALLSAGPVLSRVVFGLALVLVFVSGAVLVNQPSRYIHQRLLGHTRHRWISTKEGIAAWLLINALFVAIGWVLAQAIPTFSGLLSITSALFISGFTFMFPALIWYILVREGKWYASLHNTISTLVNLGIFIIGAVLLGAGTYASIVSIIAEAKTASKPFSCTTQ